MTYKRLARGDFQKMTPEQQRAHIIMLRARYRERNRDKLREMNRYYTVLYAKTKPFLCVCKICGCEFGACRPDNRTICDACRTKSAQAAAQRRTAIEERQKQRRDRWVKCLELARTGMMQKEISKITGVKQATISQLCLRNGIRRQPKHPRRKQA